MVIVDKFKYLLQNTMIFGISQFTSKVMVFLLLPLYTSYMTTEEYGTADLVISTVSLLLPIFTIQITNAVMRYVIESPDKNKLYFSNAIRVIIIGFVLLLLCIPLFFILNLFTEYLYLFYLLYISNAIYTLLSYYARAVDKVQLVGIVGVVNTIIVVGMNILLLVVWHFGVLGYLLSYILGYVVGGIIFVIFLRKDMSIARYAQDKEVTTEMIQYSLPLVPNSVSWWAVSSANKYIINGFLEAGILGIYSVALKIPTIINTIQNILAEALALSVLKEYDGKDKDERYFSLLYGTYNFSITFFTSIIIIGTKILSKFLFASEFYEAWIFVPLLCIPSVWGALAGYLGTFYAASKKNNGMFLSTLLGGFVTIFVSFFTIQTLGVYGVIISNIVSYLVIWLYRWIDVKKYVKIETNMVKDIFSWVILFVQSLVVMYVENPIWMYSLNVILLLIVIWLYRNIIKKFMMAIIKK